jgi:pyroglutamyl-peptidase
MGLVYGLAMILLTGFEPFQGEQINPSKEIVDRLSSRGWKDLDTLILPVAFEKAFDQVQEKLLQKKYDFILMLGQAGGRKNICFERIAINLIDTDIADEEGQRWHERKIIEDAPEAILSSLPLREWAAELKQTGHGVEISNSAGLFVCNCLYYQVSLSLETRNLFVHVPYAEEQGKSPSQSLEKMTDCIVDLLSLIQKHIK